ncbi:hypothetical protein [Pelosinus sp. IPA-1]|uniref:hypothetical protein n=1 Tax=Pelosinus sp. IPA-1 TaxID=3029569 RepID=UPI0024361CE9|nr:hypothetical protein [Pelosinus sp. IPA-1]GMB02062.1 hypothetical protein PIPA1_48620 [Pelosinus sp. IPA-1]
MIKEIDELYCYLGKLEEAYYVDISNPQECLIMPEVRMKLEVAISNVALLLTQLVSQQEGQK